MNKGLLILTVLFCSISYGQQTLETEISELFKIELKKKSIHNAYLHVHSSSKNIDIQLVEGLFKDKKTVSKAHPFYVASIGKTFTATAISLLKDKKKLQFEDKISRYLSKETMRKLHVYKNVDYSDEITIAQLLQHTSGLPDYFEDRTKDDSPNIIQQLFIHPTKMWKHEELIQFSKQKMHPLFAPGKGYHYTDTEYVLLGLIVEKISGLTLHDFFKKHIFNPLQMNHTYMNLRSKPIKKTPKMAEIYVDTFEVSSFKSLSADWAGGGIVTTTEDLLKFQKALFAEKLVNKKTLQIMQQWTPETKGMYYGFGLRKIVLNELDKNLPKLTLIGHSGSTASFMFYCPELDVYTSGTLNQTEETRNSLLLITKILKLIDQK